MDYVRLGMTGLKVSRICLGCMTYGSPKWRDWVLDYAAAKPFIARAWELGINFYDTADVYSLGESEVVLGRALKEMAVPRDRVVIATKVHSPMSEDPNHRGLSRKHILHAIDDSLRRLGLDYVDLYQIHRFDRNTPIEETLDALSDVVRSGKALYIGASSMYAWQFAKMLYVAESNGYCRFVTMQNHYNLVYREEEREMKSAMPRSRRGIDPVEPARARLPDGQPPQVRQRRNDPGKERRLCAPDVLPRLRFLGGRARWRDRGKAWRVQCTGRAGVAAASARRHGTDRRREQDGAPRRRGEGRADQAERRGAARTGRAL
jgi:aryl-alcohol dehydrogenase-like predicted oxidoreductase